MLRNQVFTVTIHLKFDLSFNTTIVSCQLIEVLVGLGSSQPSDEGCIHVAGFFFAHPAFISKLIKAGKNVRAAIMQARVPIDMR